jgi:hypothetical protein
MLNYFKNFGDLITMNDHDFYHKLCHYKSQICRRTVAENISRRQCTVKYTVNNENVCKKTVCKIFEITQRRIQCLLDKMKCKRNVEDQIGKHENR